MSCSYFDGQGRVWLMDRMLEHIKNYTTDKIVLISNATQTLDLMERLCRAKKLAAFPFPPALS